MYRNQYEYDNAEPQGPSLREIAENEVSRRLDAGDDEMLSKLVEKIALDMTTEGDKLAEALIMLSDPKFTKAIQLVSDVDFNLANGLVRLGIFADKMRAEFIKEQAEEMLKEAAE